MPRLPKPSFDSAVTAACVALCAGFTFSQLHPGLILADTTAAGGDMGAHVWAPQYLRDHLLPNWRITGWTPDWYAGFPALHFYFPLPALLIVALDLVLPYNVAFKLVAVLGVCTLPVAAWAFGRLARLPFPVPACLAAVTVPFLFDAGYSILGGNIASTLAGEFAFSIGLSLAMVFLGLVAGGLETNRHRAWAAVVFGLVILTHVLPMILAFVGGTVLFLMRLITGGSGDRWYSSRLDALRWAIPVAVGGALLSAFWLLPFVARMPFMNDMGWEKIGTGVESGMKLYDQTIVNYGDALLPDSRTPLFLFAGMGVATSLFLRRRIGIFWTIMALVAAAGFVYAPQGQLWNARLLPFWFLSLFMLAGLFAAELGWGLADVFRKVKGSWKQTGDDVAEGLAMATAPITTLIALLVVMATLPEPKWWPAEPKWWPLDARDVWHDPSSKVSQSFVPGWAAWNFSGYERKEAYPEFAALVSTMADIGRERGCGRAMWEYEGQLDRFGTPMALMLLPHRTNGCIGSMEGLYFESSATVPYHFLNQSQLSSGPSRAMRHLPYESLDVAKGVDRLQLFGVRYYLAVTPEAQAQAALEPRLNLLRTVRAAPATGDGSGSGGPRTWNIYEVAGTELVEPLSFLPAVMTDPRGVVTDFDLSPEPSRPGGAQSDEQAATHRDANEREVWTANAVTWYLDQENFDVPLAASGPSQWPRVLNANDEPARVPAGEADVTYVATSNDRIEFSVDEVGVPVLVKASYFPNWKADGASGPYRVSPNLMVVVPTENEVSLYYGRTFVDWAAMALTVSGALLVVWLAVPRRRLVLAWAAVSRRERHGDR